jgi:hypothetical protein
MTVPTLGNTPTRGGPVVLTTKVLLAMGQEAERPGGQPVIMFYRTIEHGRPFAPNRQNLDPATGQPRLVHPVTFDAFFPNLPVSLTQIEPPVPQVVWAESNINAAISGPIRQTAVGSINVGQLAVGKAEVGGNPFPKLDALDDDALAWARKVHQAAGGDVFAHYGGPRPQQAPTQQPAAAADRFASTPLPQPGQVGQGQTSAGTAAGAGQVAMNGGGQPQPVATGPAPLPGFDPPPF